MMIDLFFTLNFIEIYIHHLKIEFIHGRLNCFFILNFIELKLIVQQAVGNA